MKNLIKFSVVPSFAIFALFGLQPANADHLSDAAAQHAAAQSEDVKAAEKQQEAQIDASQGKTFRAKRKARQATHAHEKAIKDEQKASVDAAKAVNGR